MANNVKCGYVTIESEICEVFCNAETGDCFFHDPIMSDPRLIYGITVASPELWDENIDEGLMGVIYAADGVYHIITQESARFIPNEGEPHVVAIDMDADYEDLDEDEDE